MQLFKLICWILGLSLLGTIPAQAGSTLMRLSKHSMNITGNGSKYVLKFDETMSADGINYDPEAGVFRVQESGIYMISWSLPIGNLLPSNESAAAWIHAGPYESYIFNGNPWKMRNPGGVIGGGSDILAIVGSGLYQIDATEDPNVWIGLLVGGHTRKNVILLYDSFISIQKVADYPRGGAMPSRK